MVPGREQVATVQEGFLRFWVLFFFKPPPLPAPKCSSLLNFVVNADHFGAAVELESFKYLREQVYFGAPAFYLMVGLNMFKGFFCSSFQGFNPAALTSG